MKKMITSAGLVFVGAASLHAQYAPEPGLSSVAASKPWSVSATLRGFYDDNYVTRPEPFERDSWGFEVSPSLGFNWTAPQTYIGLSYIYSMRYYEDREEDSADHSHQFSAKLNHAFTERHKLDLSENFVIAQEPEVVDPATAVPLRIEGDNIRNTASATYTADLTELFGITLAYANSIYDYDLDQYAVLLNRMEHQVTFNTRWQILPTTVGIVGYQFQDVGYDGDRFLGFLGVPADVRDRQSHYVYVGADHTFNPQLNASARVGAQFTEYPNALPGDDDSTISPYADASLTWTYTQGSYFQLGVRHTRLTTDVLSPLIGLVPSVTLDQETTTVYASLNHQITAKLMGGLLANYQNGAFESGGADNQSEDYFTLGVNLTYEINKFLSAETGYNYDKLSSDIGGRDYTRNRVYLGLRATY